MAEHPSVLTGANALLIPEEEIPLSDKDQETFSLIQRMREGESLLSLAQELGITKEGLRQRIKRCAYKYSGSNQFYQDLIEDVILDRIIESEEKVEEASEKRDNVAATCAHVMLKHSQWLAERRLPKKFAPKQQIDVDRKVTVIVQRQKETPQPLVVNAIEKGRSE